MKDGRKSVVIAGSTGLVGRELVLQLAGRRDVDVTALVRRPGPWSGHAGVRERVFDFESDCGLIGTEALPCEVLLCAIGTTISAAGSQAAFAAVDRDIPIALVRRLTAVDHGVFGFVSSTGAGSPRGFYLQTKAEVEKAIRASGVSSVIVRPSLLKGGRREFRLGERLALVTVSPLLTGLASLTRRRIGILANLEPISAPRVAAALIAGTVDARPDGVLVLEGASLTRYPAEPARS